MADDRQPGVLGEVEARERRKRLIGIIAAILAIILVTALAKSCDRVDNDIDDGPDPAATVATAPVGLTTPAPYVPGGLAAYMAGDNPLPYTYELAQVTFDSGSARLGDSARDEIADIAAALRARSTARVSLRGYADPEGDAAANQQLGADRAEAVKAALIEAGAEDAQIAIAPLGETGDAAVRQNRRVELELTAR